MREVIRKLVGARSSNAKQAPIQCIFTLNTQKRKLLLLDLKAILRLPDARLALPNVANLEQTIRRNRERIRIPYDSMLVLVKEMLSVRHRIAAGSPLREIMTALPGLVNTVLTQPMPVSRTMASRDAAIKLPGIARAVQDAEVADIRSMIAKKPQQVPKSPATGTPSQAPVTAGDSRTAPPTPGLGSGLGANSRSMTPLDQRRFLEHSADLIESIALSTLELSDDDLAGYVDLCILNGDHDKVVDMLVERVGEQPRAWAWARLLELAEAARDPRFAALKERFRQWANTHQPQLLPDLLAERDDKLLHGLRATELRTPERGELGMQRGI